MTCKELVEIVTDYIEGSLPAADRILFDEHLLDCDGCRNYLEQMRHTIKLTGRLHEENLTPPQKDDLVRLFQNWKNR
jgi:predicted anti-sigma-YlaC factor YlaD